MNQVSKVAFSLVAGLRVPFHLEEGSLHECELAQFVRIDDAVDLAFDFGEDELVLRHHVERFSLQDLLLVVSDDALVPRLASLALLLELEGVFAHLVVRVATLGHVDAQLVTRHTINLFCHCNFEINSLLYKDNY